MTRSYRQTLFSLMFGPHRRGEDGNIHPSEIDRNQFDVVRSRDNHTCQICGTIWCEEDNVFTFEMPISGEERTLNNMVTVCERCFFEKSNNKLNEEARKLKKWNHIEREFSVPYTKLLLRDLKQKIRAFAHTGRFLLFRRGLVFFIGCFFATFLLNLLTGVIGGLFYSPQAGIEWFLSAWVVAYETAQTIAGTPWLIILSAGIGYITHVIERERYHFNTRIPYTKFEGEDMETSHSKYGLSRPTWQYLVIFSAVALLGGLDWVLISTGVIDNLFGAGVFWVVGTVGSAYLVRPTLHQDITEYGLRLRAGPWIGVIRYGAFFGGIGLLTASGMSGLLADMPVDFQLLLGYTGTLLPPSGDYVAVLLPGVTGLAYVGRRYLELHSRQVSQVMHGLWQPQAVVETAHNESGPGILSTVKAIPSVLNRPWSPHSNPYLGHEFESIDEEENEQETDVSLNDVRMVFDEHDGILSVSEVAEMLGASFHAVADRMEELEERGEIIIHDDDGDRQDQNPDGDSRSESHSHTEVTDTGRSDTRSNRPHDRTYPQKDPAGNDRALRSDSGTDSSHDYRGDGDTVGGSGTDETRSQYAQNKELAFDRDDRICQLCGAVGYPKTDLGLVAVPASDNDSTGDTNDGNKYAVENLVTICDTCAQNHDPEELQRQATQLKEWANVDDFAGVAADSDDSYIIDDEDNES
jgi:5-methylcytosine-specific restriction endonuclease McrA/biotin operon repressor